MRIAVIGAGASGMIAALQAVRKGASAVIYERNDIPGKKLLVTGSGRCNITNQHATAEKYSCGDPAWMASLLAEFGVRELISLLRVIGIPVSATSDGWYYPLSNSAHSVVDAFREALLEAGVLIHCNSQVTEILPSSAGFHLKFAQTAIQETSLFDSVIVAAGGRAYPNLGSRGELFSILEGLGHTVLPKRPALAPILAKLGSWKTLAGVKLDAGVTVWQSDDLVASSAGNLIITEWGFNGPAVMDISHHISKQPGKEFALSLNLLHFVEAEFRELLARKRESAMPIGILLGAFFPPKVAAALPRMAKISERTPLQKIDDNGMEKLMKLLRGARFVVEGVRGFEYCQVSAGGVPVTEADPRTMQSLKVPGLFLVGETLDVVGPCGGYNLQFAFSSGAVAGKSASK